MGKPIKAIKNNDVLYYGLFIIGYVLLLALCMFFIMKFINSVEGGRMPPMASWLKGIGIACVIMAILGFLFHLSYDYDD